jgi:hypothetical protein
VRKWKALRSRQQAQVEQAGRPQNDSQKATDGLLHRNRNGREESAREEKWDCKINEYKALHEQNLR